MAIENRFPLRTVLQTGVDVRAVLKTIVRKSVALLLGLGWMAFWTTVARIHYQQSDLTSAAFVVGVFVLPAALGLLYYLRRAI